jgi:hypothetical protein
MKPSLHHLTQLAPTVLISLALSLLVLTPTAAAQTPKIKSTKTEAKFISYDAQTQMMTVKVLKPGAKPKSRELSMKSGKKAEFKIKPEGSILARTSVTGDGQRSDIGEIPEGKTLNIYWVPYEKDLNVRFARKIDMVYTDEELEERDKRRLEEARAKGEVSD